MRLICPNCDAEYEVDAGAIPDSGRDVQCSNCGHAWFQMSPEVEAEIAAEEALFDAPPPVVTPPVAAVGSTATGAADADLSEVEFEPEPEPTPPVFDHAPRSIDESVLAVLREEAEREVEARKGETPIMEAPVVETQTELGLEAPAAGAVARRLARMKGEPEAVTKPQTRREMLPAIEEINSTLRASTERRSGQSAAIAETLGEDTGKKSGFRSGFVLMLVLAMAALAAYVMAPKLVQQFPGAAGPVQAYVAAVDALRLWADDVLKSAIGFLKGLAGGKA